MDLNEPERSEKTLNIFKLIINELKMGLNELKWGEKSQNELEWA